MVKSMKAQRIWSLTQSLQASKQTGPTKKTDAYTDEAENFTIKAIKFSVYSFYSSSFQIVY